MVDRIAHRGPDNQSVEYIKEGEVGLGHTRLSIIDLSAKSNQPLWDATRKFCITYNGEIYNYQELKRRLVQKGYRFVSDGDSEVLLNLFIEHGVAALNMLNGIFAFAIWNSLDKTLFLARDQLGVKPLYYAETDTGFVFSSEMKSLLCDQSISRDIDAVAISHYLKFLWCPSPQTPLKSVRKLEPGQRLLVADGEIRDCRKYFELPISSEPYSTYDQCKDMLNRALHNSVRRQLVSDVDVGAFLSGGLDSSSVVAIASRELGAKNLPCYTIDFEDADKEGMHADLPYAKRVAAFLGTPLEVIRVTPNIAEDLPRLVYQLDEPQADLAPLNAWYIADLARRQGIKVLLSGAGGDDLLTGYRRHYAVMQERYWSWWPKPIREILEAGTRALPKNNVPLRRIAKAFEYAGWSASDRVSSYFYWLHPDKVSGLVNANLNGDVDPIAKSISDLPDSMTRLQKMLYIDIRFFLADHNFNYTDKVSMAEGVEVRVPLVDREMVDVSMRIPDKYKQHGKHGKWIFKKAMEGMLPKDVIYRPKTGFGVPIRSWLKGELRPMVDELLSPTSLNARGLFNSENVATLIAQDRKGAVDATYTVLSLMVIELWCRQFIDVTIPGKSI
jgi:asparagine synthase (glutamine-hydrolysing)